MKLCALTFGDESCASSQYRIFQYRKRFEEAGVDLVCHPAKGFTNWEILSGCDAVILQKTLLSGKSFRRLRRLSKRLIYDADDRIWLRPGKPHGLLTRWRINFRLRWIAAGVDACLAPNRVICEDLKRAGAGDVRIVPMALDGALWRPTSRARDAVTIGWSGSPKNLVFLASIAPQLIAVKERHPEVRIAIHCGQKPDFPGLEFEHIPYELGGECEAVNQFDIGLLPLPDDPFVAGKSPIKALQYFACGVAVVGEARGATAELLEDRGNGLVVGSSGAGEERLIDLSENPDLRESLGRGGRETFERRHTVDSVFGLLLDSIVAEPDATTQSEKPKISTWASA